MEAKLWGSVALATTQGIGQSVAAWNNVEAAKISAKEQIDSINLSVDDRIAQRAQMANQEIAVAEVRAAAGGTEGSPSVMKGIAKDAAADINAIRIQGMEATRQAKYQESLARHQQRLAGFNALLGIGTAFAVGGGFGGLFKSAAPAPVATSIAGR